MRVKLKAGCRVRGMSPEICFALMVAQAVYAELGSAEFVVTECTGGVHRDGSLHNTGEAVDIRSRTFTHEEKQEAVRLIQHRLRDQYDVVLETTHIHIEHDP